MTSPLPLFEGWSSSMAWAAYEEGQWGESSILAQGTRPIHPGAMALQFGASVFEGSKAFRISATEAHAFRLADHHARLQDSCARLGMPCPSYELYEEAVRSVVGRADSWNWPIASNWLYIRPVMIGLDDHIMPMLATRYALYVLVAPIRPFCPPSFNLWIEERYSRAAPGGLGAAKTGANYAHQLYPTVQAKKSGCDAVLWLDPYNRQTIEEGSTMNVFFRVGCEVVTPVLKDTILPGITRRSVIAILKSEGWKVSEREVTVNEVLGWIAANELDEAFATSTALGVRAIDSFRHGGQTYLSAHNLELSQRLKGTLEATYAGDSRFARGWLTSFPVAGA